MREGKSTRRFNGVSLGLPPTERGFAHDEICWICSWSLDRRINMEHGSAQTG
jgi:hypothetical protein